MLLILIINSLKYFNKFIVFKIIININEFLLKYSKTTYLLKYY